jgi:hypothetical protein
MSRKQFVFLAAFLLLGASLALADSRLRILLPGDPGPAQSHRLWAWNLSSEPADLLGESSPATKVRVDPGEALEVSELLRGKGPAGLPENAAVLLVAAPRDFDPSALAIDEAPVRLEKAGRRVRARVFRPAWAVSLSAMAAGKGQLAEGESGDVSAEADADGRVRLAAALERGTAIKVIVKDEQGEVLKSFTVTSGAPVRLQVDLGSAGELAGARLALQVHRGRVAAGISRAAGGGLRPISTKAVICDSYVSPSNVIYSGSYTYSVTGCPANTCGEINIRRNGNWEFTGNWICTDGSGNATKGPWNWSDKASDETGDPIFIRWPSNDTTDDEFIIVDKACAQTYRTSPNGSPPTSFAGYATDNTWGAGFDFGGSCFCVFNDLTSPGSSTAPNASMLQSGRWYTSWSCTPPSTVSGHQYEWYACCHDGYCGVCSAPLYFTKP